jgi:hypothetical protein
MPALRQIGVNMEVSCGRGELVLHVVDAFEEIHLNVRNSMIASESGSLGWMDYGPVSFAWSQLSLDDYVLHDEAAPLAAQDVACKRRVKKLVAHVIARIGIAMLGKVGKQF